MVGLGRPAVRLDGDPGADGVGGVAVEQHLVLAPSGISPAGDHACVGVLEPQLVDLARGRGGMSSVSSTAWFMRLRAHQRGARAAAEVAW